MSTSEQVTRLVRSLVIPDRTADAAAVDAAATARTLEAILQGGKEAVLAVIGLLDEPGVGDDAKARYALHALAVRVAAARDEPQRRGFAETLAAALHGKRTRAAREFLVAQLQVVGRQEVVADLGKLLTDEALCDAATRALLAIRTGAADPLRAALPKLTGRSRLAVAQALGVLRDEAAAPTLRKLAADRDADLRHTALWALAAIPDPAAVDLLIRSTGGDGYERAQVGDFCLLMADRLQAGGNKAEASRLYRHVQDTYAGSHEAHLRAAAARGLAGK